MGKEIYTVFWENARTLLNDHGMALPDINTFFDPNALCKDIITFCKDRYKGVGKKMQEEFFVTSYYAAMCLTILHIQGDNSYAKEAAFSFLQTKCDTEFCDVFSDRLLGYKRNSIESDKVWELFQPYLGTVIEYIKQLNRLTDEILYATMPPALAMGIAVAKEYYELEETEDSDYAGKQISVEALIGRNFYHYVDGVVDKEQPFTLDIVDIEVDDDLEGEEDEDEDVLGFSPSATLSAYIPRDCWIKRLSATEDNYNANRLIVIELVDNYVIENVSEVMEEIQSVGGSLLMIPGVGTLSSRSYEIQDYLSDETDAEMELLLKKRILPQGFSFKGKRLPQEIIDEGDEEGGTEYTVAIPSPHRQANLDLDITTSEEGIIEDFDYSTYQSTGSSYWDMFSRPTYLDDRHEEIVDVLLYIIDNYSDEEYETVVKKE